MRTIDKGHDLPVYSPVCSLCIHLNWRAPEFGKSGTCRAFPDGIPEDIWTGADPHTKPHDGDKGILFKRANSGDS